VTSPSEPLITDFHVHLAALPEGDNGCFISKKMLKGPLFRFLAWRLGLPIEDASRTNRIYLERLVATLKASRHVRKAVVLAMDGVYDARGNLDREKTEFLISNRYVLEAARAHPGELLAGASVNPARRDALEELDRCAAAGAFLVKVLPNTQNFNPGEERYRDFYRAMARHKLPLLSHVGYEFTLWGKDQSVGDPARLRVALEEGVTVIAAHGASFGLFFYEKYWDTLGALVRDYSNFYWDASALSLPNRVGMLLRLRGHPKLLERMVFGTDYPLPVFAYPALLAGRLRGFAELCSLRNPFDRQFRLLQTLGFPPGSFPP